MPAHWNLDLLYAAYREKFFRSSALYERALKLFPNGVTHDGRFLKPFPAYIREAHDAVKITVEGHEVIDYWMGHGALILGYADPAVVEALGRQAAIGTHWGGCHELELEWGELIQKLYPSAERIRFTASGTEATLMAVRLARAATGRALLVKFQGHFHGWHDSVASGNGPTGGPSPWGVPLSVAEGTVVLPPNDLTPLEAFLSQRAKEIAGVIIEPTGASYGTVPLAPGFLKGVREVTRKYDVPLILDEVITGFRMAPGGMAEVLGIEPELATLAKILCGGLPGGAVVGKQEFLQYLEIRDDTWNRDRKIKHFGTYNANPLSAAAGIATLRRIAENPVCEQAKANGLSLRDALDEVFQRRCVPACVFGDGSIIHYVYSPEANLAARPNREIVPLTSDYLLAAKGSDFNKALRLAMLVEGVDLPLGGGWLCVKHGPREIVRTAEALDRAIEKYWES